MTKYFALGSLLGGMVVSLVSCYIVRDAEVSLWQMCAGYMMFGCLAGLIYGVGLVVLGFGWVKPDEVDGRRAMISGALCSVAQYVVHAIANRQDFDRILMVAVPLCAALAARCRRWMCNIKKAPLRPQIKADEHG